MSEPIILHGAGVEARAAALYFQEMGGDLAVFDDAGATIDGVPNISASEAMDRVRDGLYLRSPGVVPEHELAKAARQKAQLATTPTGYWLSRFAPANTTTITGTKGKSTTTALTSLLLQNLGLASAAYGNIGQPPLGHPLPTETHPVVEVSSFMAYDLPPADHLHVITALYQDHLDWHGTLEAYHEAKLRPFRRDHPARGLARQALIDGWDLPSSVIPLERLVTVKTGSMRIGETPVDLGTEDLGFDQGPLQTCLSFAAGVGALLKDAAAVRGAAEQTLQAWRGLPSRQAVLETRDGRIWVDDTLATIPEATLAALHRFRNKTVVLLLGGADRGQDFSALERYLLEADQVTAIGFDPTAERMGGLTIKRDTLEEAIDAAASRAEAGTVVLFSPAAPSHHPYKNYQERSAAFARKAKAAT